jgi:hypothetical protein
LDGKDDGFFGREVPEKCDEKRILFYPGAESAKEYHDLK